jgi:Ca-activated chloride channel family protein
MSNRAASLTALAVLPFIAAPSGAATPPATAPAAVSPSKVLAALGAGPPQRAGQFYLPNGPTDSVDAGADRSLAPYLYVAGGDPETERLPLRETSARLDVAGVIARARVHQVFENGGKRPIEAVYVFPASTRAAVHGMRMKVGDRVIEAHIDRRQAAREDYEAARAQGRRASLLEQERPNVFTMNVANVMPGDRIEVELDYSELLVPEDSVYELVYPAVVGPRYAGHADPKADRWMANPHLPAGQPAPYRFDVAVHLETGVALKAVSSPSHEVEVRYGSPSSADVTLRAPGQGGDRDYILRYRLAEDRIETGLLLSPPEAGGEGFFALMMEPPRNPAPAQIPGREYVFLLDVSGSMHGFPLDTAKALMRKLLGQLRPTDKFDLALFSGANYVMSPGGSVPATPANIASAVELVERQTGGGGTELMGGLQAAYGIPRGPQAMSRTVVVVTDGYVGVEAQAFRFIREHLGEANLFAFGIGTSVNRALIEGMARAGQGEPFVVLRPEKAAGEAEKLRAMIAQPVLTHVAVAFDGFGATEVSPAKVPDLLARRPLIVFGKWSGQPGGRIRVSGIGGGGAPFARAVEVRAADETPRNEALRWLWARNWVSTLDDERHMGGGKPVEDAITDLGLRYSLLTSFTSFVAVDKEIANHSGQAETVRQPLPMPAGVSNLAVEGVLGGKASSSGGGATGYLNRAVPRHNAYAAAEAVAPPPPAAAPASSSAREEGDDKRAKKPAPKGDKDKEGPAILVRGASASGLDDTAPLRAAIVARLRGGAGCSARAVEVVLRLTVDAAGKVAGVERVSGDDAAAGCVRARLMGLTSATRATGGKPGVWTVTIRVG